MAADRPRILVKEKIADSGVDLLREHFDVDLGVDWDDAELEQRIGDYDGIVIRSATQLTPELIARGERLKVIGRAGVGVDNVDVPAATARGIVVANAPQSNVIAAAEHTIALLLALARNVPQAHGSLTSGKWERSKFGGIEVYEKTLGILGFGRIGQLVAQRARSFGMNVLGYDPYVSAERFRELGAEQGESLDDVLARADFLTIHLPNTPDTKGFLNAETLAKCKRGVRVINCARGSLVDDAALKDAIDSGQVGGAALDVFATEPITDHPLFDGYDNVVVTPHLGASTSEAQDRAGVQTAEQVVAALTGGAVTNAVNIPTVGAEDMEVLAPFMPLCQALGKLAVALAGGPSIDRLEVEYLGRVAEFDTRLLTVSVLLGALAGHTEESVNLVNAPSLAEVRGIDVAETKRTTARDFTDLIRVTIAGGGEPAKVVGTTVGHHHRPHLLEAWGQRFDIQLESHVTLLRYTDAPGMIGRVGTVFGEQGVNIVSAAVGRLPDGADGEAGGGGAPEAIMALTTDGPVRSDVLEQIVASEGFIDGRTVAL